MSDRVRIDQLAAAVMEGLTEYADLAADELKKAVRKAGDSVKKDIQANAPKDTGAYAKSWAVKNVKETSNSIEVVVHSRNRYQLSHLLEFGHAKRGGGRVPGKAHIAPAEERAGRTLEQEIEKALRG
ncbi:MAG: HK97 gp10 family phage protein [Enterocloster citroniae]|nr:HK97 gp10 family phage protein [Enterocloster citroniae]